MNGFISYAHNDHGVLGPFREGLRQAERLTGVNFWADKRIRAGNYWRREIADRIAEADVALLLASPAFADSDYIWDHELPAIATEHRRRNTLVIPVVAKPMMIELIGEPFQAVPATAQGALVPLSEWKPQRNGVNEAIRQITESICAHHGIVPKTPFRDLFGGKP